MLTKMLKPLTLSFLLTALCVALAMWTTSSGLAVDNMKCGGTVTVVSKDPSGGCSDFSQNKCGGGTVTEKRKSNRNCNVSDTSYTCEEPTKKGETTTWKCYWSNGSCRTKGGSTSHTGTLDSCRAKKK